jgi:hypothetical protein
MDWLLSPGQPSSLEQGLQLQLAVHLLHPLYRLLIVLAVVGLQGRREQE